MERQFKQLFEDYFKEKRRKLSKLKGSCQSWNVVVVNCSLIRSVTLTSYVDKWPFLFMSESSYSQKISLRHRFGFIFLYWNCLSTNLRRDSRNSAVSQLTSVYFFSNLLTTCQPICHPNGNQKKKKINNRLNKWSISIMSSVIFAHSWIDAILPSPFLSFLNQMYSHAKLDKWLAPLQSLSDPHSLLLYFITCHKLIFFFWKKIFYSNSSI